MFDYLEVFRLSQFGDKLTASSLDVFSQFEVNLFRPVVLLPASTENYAAIWAAWKYMRRCAGSGRAAEMHFGDRCGWTFNEKCLTLRAMTFSETAAI